MEPIVEYDAEHMKKGGRVKKKKPQGNQTQTVNVYVTKRMSQPRAKQAKQVQQQLPPGVPMSMLSNLANFPFARQDPGFVRMGDIRPSLNQSYDSSEYLPNRPVKLTQPQLNKPIELNNQMQNFPKQKVISLPAFQPQPPPRVIPGLFDKQPMEDQFKKIEEDVKLQERYQEEEELKEKLREEMEAQEAQEAPEPQEAHEAPIKGSGSMSPLPRDDEQQQYEKEKQRFLVNKSRELNKMVVKSAKDKSGKGSLEDFVVKQLGITVPREKRSKPDLVRIAMNYYKENYDRLGE